MKTSDLEDLVQRVDTTIEHTLNQWYHWAIEQKWHDSVTTEQLTESFIERLRQQNEREK